jgi:hypothetical protein
MGIGCDRVAVIDNRGRFFGVTGLRVVDARASPILPPGTLNRQFVGESCAKDFITSNNLQTC